MVCVDATGPASIGYDIVTSLALSLAFFGGTASIRRSSSEATRIARAGAVARELRH